MPRFIKQNGSILSHRKVEASQSYLIRVKFTKKFAACENAYQILTTSPILQYENNNKWDVDKKEQPEELFKEYKNYERPITKLQTKRLLSKIRLNGIVFLILQNQYSTS